MCTRVRAPRYATSTSAFAALGFFSSLILALIMGGTKPVACESCWLRESAAACVHRMLTFLCFLSNEFFRSRLPAKMLCAYATTAASNSMAAERVTLGSIGYLAVSAVVSQRSALDSSSMRAEALAAAPDAIALMVWVDSARLPLNLGLLRPLAIVYGFRVAFFKKSGQVEAVDHMREAAVRFW